MQTMLITGTRKGIGRHLVDHYVAQGYRVVGCSRSAFDDQVETTSTLSWMWPTRRRWRRWCGRSPRSTAASTCC